MNAQIENIYDEYIFAGVREGQKPETRQVSAR